MPVRVENLADETPTRLPAAIAVLGLEAAVAAHAYGWGLKQYRRQSDDGFELPLPHAGELILTRRIAKTADTPARHQPLAAVLQTEDGTLGPLWLADPDTLVWFGGTQRVWFEFPSVQEQWTVFQRRRPDDRRE